MKNNCATIKNFLKTALLPVGETMYIWGGGWNEEENKAGKDTLRIGKNPQWHEFFKAQTADYNFKDHLYKHGFGLDCSGYVGWVMYNFIKTAYGNARSDGYVFRAGDQAKRFAEFGFGSYTRADSVTDFKAGDIMSSPEHVYITIGECPDGSVVLLHSSPPGVQLCGTYSKSGIRFSQASYLARTYMGTHFGNWYKKFGCRIKDTSYLKQYSQFRWDTTRIISDPDKLREKSAADVLRCILPDKTARP